MSNKLITKHGQSPPTVNDLEQFELGFAESDDGLYIKKNDDEVIQLNNKSIPMEINIDSTIIKSGELGYNFDDGKLYINNGTQVVPVSGSGGIIVSDTAPEDTELLWIDIGNGGISKYYDIESSTWKPTAAVWG